MEPPYQREICDQLLIGCPDGDNNESISIILSRVRPLLTFPGDGRYLRETINTKEKQQRAREEKTSNIEA